MEENSLSIWKRIFSNSNDSYQERNSSVLEFQIGDTVSHDLIDYLMVGLTTYKGESGRQWIEYSLEGDGETWLIFEKDLQLAAVYKPADMDLTGKPTREIKYEGKLYYLHEVSRAEIIEVNGEPSGEVGQMIRYWQYLDETGGYVLCAKNRGGDLKVSCGYYIGPHELRLIRKLRAIY